MQHAPPFSDPSSPMNNLFMNMQTFEQYHERLQTLESDKPQNPIQWGLPWWSSG